MKRSAILDFIFGFETSEEEFSKSHFSKNERHFSAKILSSIGSSFAKKLSTGVLPRIGSFLFDRFALGKINSYGSTIFAFGLMTVLLNLVDYYLRSQPGSPASALTSGAVLMLLSIPLLFINTPLLEFMLNHKFTDILLFEILCMKRVAISDTRREESGWIYPVLIGAMIAVVGYFTSLTAVLLILALLIFAALAFSSPEFSLIATVAVLPAIPLLSFPTLAISALVGITAVSFVSKVFLGKRLYHFEQYDAIISFFIVFVLISGTFNKDFNSFAKAISLILLTFSYFLASNIIINKRLADNMINVLLFTSIPTAIYAIIDYFFLSGMPSGWIDPSTSPDITRRATATFGNPNIYAVYLLVTVIFALTFSFDKTKSKNTRIYYGAVFALNGYAMVLTWTRGAWLALIFALAAFAVIRSRRAPKALLITLASLPIAITIMPESVIQRLLSSLNLSDSSILSRLSIWRSSIAMMLDNLFIGIGVGDKAFSEEFLKYAEDSVSAPHSHNLFLEIGCEFGIFALLLFVFIILTRIRHRASYARYVRKSTVNILSLISGTAFFALITYGMTDYIWYNTTMYALFWLVFGLGSATLRIAKKEYLDSVIPIDDYTSESFASADITVIHK